MIHTKIFYSSGYKYQLRSMYLIATDIKPPANIQTDFILLTTSGLLELAKGYAWDGASGPAFDTKNFMRGSLVHDAFYQLLELELISRNFKKQIDQELIKICRQDGMSWLRAQWVYLAVRGFGCGCTPKPILIAP